jgi:mannose-6-phosphate isomerase-like protein (cupin superfamily)
MKGYITNIENRAFENTNYREVLFTTEHTQLVVMCIAPGDETGMSVHAHSDQFYRFKGGRGKVTIDDTVYDVNGELLLLVPAGARHNILNTSQVDALQLYTLYAPPFHRDGTVHATKQDAIDDPGSFDGNTSDQMTA